MSEVQEYMRDVTGYLYWIKWGVCYIAAILTAMIIHAIQKS